MNPEEPSSEFDQSAGEQLAALRQLLREAHQADQVPLDVPPALDAQIVANGVANMARNRNVEAIKAAVPPPLPRADGNSLSKEEPPGKVIRVPFRRRLMWLAAAGAIMLGGGWWFRHWTETPITRSAGYQELVQRPAEPARKTRLPDAGSVTNALRLAEDSRRADRPGDALEYYEQVLARESTQRTALLEQGKLWLERHNFVRAEERFDQLLEVHPADLEARFQQAVVWTEAGNYTEAATELDSLLAGRPDDARLLAVRARVEELLGRFESALALRKKALLVDPGDPQTQGEFREFFESAVSGLELSGELVALAVAETNPEKRTALKLFAVNELARRDELTNATTLVGEVLAEDPGNTEARYLQSRILVHQRQFQQAEAILRELLQAPNPATAWRLELAHVLHHQGRTPEFWEELAAVGRSPGAASAIKNFEYATHRRIRTATDPDFARIDQLLRDASPPGARYDGERLLQHVTWLRRAGAFDAAREVLEQAFAQDDSALLRLAWSELLNATGAFARGRQEADMALQYNPGLARASWARGFAFEGLGELGEAGMDYYRALLLDPHLRAAAHGLVRIRDKQKQPRRSADDFGELMRQHPSGSLQYLLWRSYAWGRGGFPARALEDVEKAAGLAPWNLGVLAAKADVFAGLGRYDQARETARIVITRSPDHRVSNMVLGKIAIDFGELEDAEMMQQRLDNGDNPYESSFLKGMIELSRGRYADSIRSMTTSLSHAPNESLSWEFRGLAGLLGGEFAIGVRDYQSLLRRFGTNDQRAGRWLMNQYLALRGAGQTNAAATLLKGALANVDSCQWTYPVLRLFAGELPQELVVAKSQEIAFETLKKTDSWSHRAFGYEVAARASLGLFAEFEGDYESARAHYRWLIEHPDPMWLPYLPMATNRLQGLDSRVGRARLRTIPDLPGQADAGWNDGLLVWLPMEHDLNDHGPSRLPVSLRGNVRLENGMARFPGDGNFLELPHVSLKQKEFSISFWTKYAGSEDHYSLFSQKESDDCDRALYLQLVRGDALRFGFFEDDVVTPSGMPERRQWNHVVFQYSRYRQTIWLNGRLLVERLSAPYEAGSGTCRIGAMPTEWAGHHEFDGWMRDFRIYGRALRPEEIQRLAGVVDTGSEQSVAADAAEPRFSDGVRQALRPSTEAENAALADARPFLQIAGNQLLITAPPVQVYELQFTPDLNLDWSYLTTLTNTTGSVNYVDEGALAEGMRFYRVQVRTSETEDTAPQ